MLLSYILQEMLLVLGFQRQQPHPKLHCISFEASSTRHPSTPLLNLLKMTTPFKNLIIFRLSPTWIHNLQGMQEALAQTPFVMCSASQEKSIGWAPPRGEEHGSLVESVGGQLLLSLMMESKAVPTALINRKAKEQLATIEADTGRKPGKRQTKEIKEDIRLALMPMAFTKVSSTTIWIDPAAKLLVVNAGSQSKADEAVTFLVKSLDGFSVLPFTAQTSCTVAMSEWLSSQDAPNNFTIDRECELKSPDESKSVVRYSRHALDLEEITQHIASGKVPTKLAMTWNERVSFVLTDTLQLKKIAFLDGVFDGSVNQATDGFDADAAIATGELSRLIPDLLDALGGIAPQ
jgi:recombination associated protein RdgC